MLYFRWYYAANAALITSRKQFKNALNKVRQKCRRAMSYSDTSFKLIQTLFKHSRSLPTG